MVDELDIGQTAISIQAHSDGNQEIVLGHGAEDASHLLVDEDILLLSDIVLAVDINFTDAANLLTFLRDESESLVEWEKFLALVHNLL